MTTDRSCQSCARFQVGSREVAGYVLCGWDQIEVDATKPRELGNCPRTLQRPTLGQVWIRSDAAVIVACHRWLSTERATRVAEVVKPTVVRSPAARDRDARYRERTAGPMSEECPICHSPMTERNRLGQRRQVCNKRACQAEYSRRCKATLPSRVEARHVVVGGSKAGARGE